MRAFLFRDRTEADVDTKKAYKQITVKLYGKGVVLRKVLSGGEIKTRPQFTAKKGQLIISRIDARNGAFGIVPPELDEALVTQDFPLFIIDSTMILPQFLTLLLQSEQFVNACKNASRGTTNRKRLKEELFLEEKMPVPPTDIQEKTIAFLRQIEELRTGISHSGIIIDDLITAIGNRVFK